MSNSKKQKEGHIMTIFKEIKLYSNDNGAHYYIDLDNGESILMNGYGTGYSTDGTLYEKVFEGIGEPYLDGSGHDEYRVIGWRKV